MCSSHFLVEPEDGALGCCVANFLVDVVCTTGRIEGEPDAIALNTCWLGFDDVLNSKNFAVCGLKARDAGCDCPEFRLCDNFIVSEHLDTDRWWVWNGFCRIWARNNLVVLQHLMIKKRKATAVKTVNVDRYRLKSHDQIENRGLMCMS